VAEAGDFDLTVYNLRGQVVGYKRFAVSPGKHRHSFQMDESRNLASGIYILSIAGSGKTYNQRLTYLK
jgi:hypothetical protein